METNPIIILHWSQALDILVGDVNATMCTCDFVIQARMVDCVGSRKTQFNVRLILFLNKVDHRLYKIDLKN